MTNGSNASQQNASRSCEESRPEGGEPRQHPALQLSILTTHHKQFHPEWVKRTVLLPGWFEVFPRAADSYWRSLLWSWRLFRESRHFDAVVTGAEHVGQMFALMQSLFRTKSSRRVHVMIDFPWAVSPGRLTLLLKRIQMWIAIRSIDQIFAHASPEEEVRFSEALGVSREKFRFVPFHYCLNAPEPTVSEGDYIFSGGYTSRDYQTLIRAVAGMPYRTVICTRQTSYFSGVDIPANVEVATVNPGRFDELIAGARVLVVPLPEREIHTGGHTVIVNAMKLGKPIIVLGRAEYKSYLEHGKTGLLLTPGDSASLRAAIDRLFAEPEFARFLARNAHEAAAAFSPEIFFERVFEAVEAAFQAKLSQH
jgi:glycosyltransferase involved in cell wall biosynthesis